MRKKIYFIGKIITILFMLTSCNNGVNGTKKTVGNWYHEISNNMGGFEISANTKLSIKRNGPGDYDYSIATTITDQMYGGQPKTEISNGKLDEVVENGKWKFLTGDYGNRGGYIVVPSDEWENNSPNEIEIEFESGRGNSMTFQR